VYCVNTCRPQEMALNTFHSRNRKCWSISILLTLALVKVFFNIPPHATVWSNAKPCWLRNIKQHCDLDTASFVTCWDCFIWSAIKVVKIKMCLHIQYCKCGWSPAQKKPFKKKGVIATHLFTPPNYVLYLFLCLYYFKSVWSNYCSVVYLMQWLNWHIFCMP